jgi:ABC-type sugar transport system ATPase subunit
VLTARDEADLKMTAASVEFASRDDRTTESLLEVRALTKVFPGVIAVDNVDLSVAPGEIVALLGQNGAGKSTLIQVLSGVYPFGSYSGEIRMGGAAFRPGSVSEAELNGIAFLAQEVNVAADLTVAESMSLNNEPARFGLIDNSLRISLAKKLLADFGVDVDPNARIGDFELATQQLLLIVRALSKNVRLLILDEPTAALNEREATRLFGRMRVLSARGVAIIFVSHRLAEVFEVSDRIVVMRDGRIGGQFTTSRTSRDEVVAQMVGISLGHGKSSRKVVLGTIALAAKNFTVIESDRDARAIVSGLDLVVHHGEIVGLFGLLGAGAIETAMALFGAWRGQRSGDIFVDGALATIGEPADAVNLGVGLIAQDRRDGLSPEHTIYENAIIANLKGFSTHGLINRPISRRRTMDLAERLNIKMSSIDALVSSLSGGNQQKVQVARWLAAGVTTLLLIDPTRGVDVGARSEIKRIWAELADAGCAILLVSSDAEELVEICDRVLVLRGGGIAAELPRSELNEERLLRLATGV